MLITEELTHFGILL